MNPLNWLKKKLTKPAGILYYKPCQGRTTSQEAKVDRLKEMTREAFRQRLSRRKQESAIRAESTDAARSVRGIK